MARVSHFVTDGSETVGIRSDGSGTGATEKPDGLTPFGSGGYRLESPSVGSTPGHPKLYSYPGPREAAYSLSGSSHSSLRSIRRTPTG